MSELAAVPRVILPPVMPIISASPITRDDIFPAIRGPSLAERLSSSALPVLQTSLVALFTKENAAAFAVSSLSGIALKFALVAAIVTCPATAVPMVAVALGAAFGGVTRLIVHRIKKKEWSTKAFVVGAGFGMLGGYMGLKAAEYLLNNGFMHSFFTGTDKAVRHLVTPPTLATPTRLVIPSPLSETDQFKTLINTDSAFKGQERLKKAALYAVDHGNWKQAAARLADAAYLQSLKEHGITKRSAQLWNVAAKIISDHKVTSSPTVNQIVVQTKWVNSLRLTR